MSMENAALVLGVAIAAITLLGLLGKGAGMVWRTVRRVNRYLDEISGDPERGIPSQAERIRSIQDKLDQHIDNHNPPLGALNRRPAQRR